MVFGQVIISCDVWPPQTRPSVSAAFVKDYTQKADPNFGCHRRRRIRTANIMCDSTSGQRTTAVANAHEEEFHGGVATMKTSSNKLSSRKWTGWRMASCNTYWITLYGFLIFSTSTVVAACKYILTTSTQNSVCPSSVWRNSVQLVLCLLNRTRGRIVGQGTETVTRTL